MAGRDVVMHTINNPFLQWLGVRLTAWSDGFAEMQLEAQPHLANRTGRVQGGVICTLLDAAGGYAGLYRLPDSPQPESVTLSLTTNFLDSGSGALLVAKGTLERRGRGIYFARSELWLDSTVLLATAIGTFKYVRLSST